MAGSNKWFVYTADNTWKFACFRDESNTEAVNGTDSDYTPASPEVYGIPLNLKPRYVVYRDGSGLVTRKVTVMTLAAFAAPPATITDSVSGLTLGLAYKRGERLSIPYPGDTGLIDGDAT